MKAKRQGSDIRVDVSLQEVRAHKEQWPDNDLPDKRVTFIFEKNGDLADIFPNTFDGPAAVALSQDAWKFAEKELELCTKTSD